MCVCGGGGGGGGRGTIKVWVGNAIRGVLFS